MAKNYKYYSLMLAIFVEVLQVLLPYRSLNLFDLTTNLLGITLGLLYAFYFKKNKTKILNRIPMLKKI